MASIKPIVLHGAAGPNPTKVRMLIEELGLPHEIKEVSFADVKGPEFTAINPNGRMPAIYDPNTDLTLWESGAIIEYLIEKYDTKKQFQPKGEAQLKDNQFWMHWAEGSAIAPLVIALVMQNIDEQTPWPVKPIAWAITSQVKKTFLFPNIKLNFEYIVCEHLMCTLYVTELLHSANDSPHQLVINCTGSCAAEEWWTVAGRREHDRWGRDDVVPRRSSCITS